MASFRASGSITDLQTFNSAVYGLVDDRMYSVSGLLAQVERFGMRALKGIRKSDPEQIEKNLLIAFSWLIAVANRLHLSLEEELWARFPGVCSYCGKRPCVCKLKKVKRRVRILKDSRVRPHTLAGYQKMFAEIYPPQHRTVVDAGIHLAEEIGEVLEAVERFMGEHKDAQMNHIRLEIADCVSCMFGIANSADIEVAAAMAKLFPKGCHVCHKTPCVCLFFSHFKP